jgi:WD40 repeat protein
MHAHGDVLATGGDGEVCLWSLATGDLMQVLDEECEGWIDGVSHRGDHLASCGGWWGTSFKPDLNVRLWSVGEERIVAKLRGHTPTHGGQGYVHQVVINDLGQVVSVGSDTSARVWDVSVIVSGDVRDGPYELDTLADLPHPAPLTALSVEGRTAVTGCEDSFVRSFGRGTSSALYRRA